MPDAPTAAAPHHAVVVAVDGPAGSGKTTVSRELARRLGLRWLDTGATYRGLTWAVLAAHADPADEPGVLAVAERTRLEVSTDPDRPWTRVNGADVTTQIRGPEVTAAVSAVSAHPAVRRRLVAFQQGIVGDGGIVVEGRDIGSVVCRDAPVKVFLTADPEVRAARRAAEQAHDDVAAASADLARRDRLDSTRRVDPLAPAPDAHVLDASDLPVGDVVARVLELLAPAVPA